MANCQSRKVTLTTADERVSPFPRALEFCQCSTVGPQSPPGMGMPEQLLLGTDWD